MDLNSRWGVEMIVLFSFHISMKISTENRNNFIFTSRFEHQDTMSNEGGVLDTLMAPFTSKPVLLLDTMG